MTVSFTRPPALPGQFPRPSPNVIKREVRAQFTDTTVRVYQVVPRDMADAALDAGTFVAPFHMAQMTWIKPSFLSVLSRWEIATGQGPHTLLAVDIKRAAFEWLLATACDAAHQADLHPTREAWARRMAETSVRLHWDQEKTVLLKPLAYRSVAIGISGETMQQYVDDWIVSLTSSDGLAQWISTAKKSQRYIEAAAHLPVEQIYPLAPETAAAIGVSVAAPPPCS